TRPHLALPSFPTRRSSDLVYQHLAGLDIDDGQQSIVGLGKPEPVSQKQRRGHVGSAAIEFPEDLGAIRHVSGGIERDGQASRPRSEEHTSELQSLTNLVCR